MSDQEIRALERQVQADPVDTETQVRLFTARRRAGVPIESYFRLRNIQNGKYFQYWDSYGHNIRETIASRQVGAHEHPQSVGFFKSREAALKEVKALHKRGAELSTYQLVEFQTMTLEIAGPIVSTMMDQIEVELLHAKKELQLKKLQKLEVEEQELLKQRTLVEKAKLQKLEAKEASLQKKVEGTK